VRTTQLALALAAGAALLTAAPEAHANGRFPESNAFFFAPNDPDLVIMRVTFGLMVSHDRGKTWDWICERSIGLAGVEDPMFTVTPDNTLLGSTFQGLVVSRDRGCGFSFYTGDLRDLVFIDLTSRPATPSEVIAFASSYAGQDDAGTIFFKSTLFETKDQGGTFAPLPGGFDPTMLGQTVDIAPSDPTRIYVSMVREPGQITRRAFMLTSRDHGATYEEYSIPLEGTEKAAFIAAVDPTNADRVYVRTSNATDKPSRLLVSDDAGKTYRTVLTAKGPLAGFALSPDGTKVWAGGPVDGLQMASTSDFVFAEKSKIEIGCLAYQRDGLWACSTEKSGFVAGVSQDDGATFEAKLHFCDVRGPLVCPETSGTHVECTLGGPADRKLPPWPPQRAALGCEVPDAGVLEGGTDAGVPGAAPEDDGGCSVRRAPSAYSPFAAAVAAFAALVALARRRRR